MICLYKGESISHHNLLRDHIFQVASQAALAPANKERALILGRNYCPADVYLPNWFDGKETAFDIMVVSPMQQALKEIAAAKKGCALKYPYDKKWNQAG